VHCRNVLFQIFQKNGQIERKAQFKNHKLDGTEWTYYSNGQVNNKDDY
jgi:antitoxin component YwqK of YwqJK toxin-antitoxin module